MKLGNFWGLTGPMFVVAYPVKEEAIPVFRMMASTINNDALLRLQQELTILSRVAQLLEYQANVSISEELASSYCKNGVVDESVIIGKALEKEIAERSIVRAAELSRKGQHKDLSDLPVLVHAFVAQKNFQLARVGRIVKEFVASLPDACMPQHRTWAAEYGLPSQVVTSVVLDGKQRKLTASERKVCAYFASRCADIQWWIQELRPGKLVDESIFGIPFFNLVKRKPESLRYAVLNVFERVKGNNSIRILEKVANAVKVDLARYRELYRRYVCPMGDSGCQILGEEDISEIIEGKSQEVAMFFKELAGTGCLVQDDYLPSDFRQLVDLGERVLCLKPSYLNEIFGLCVNDWNLFGEQLSEIGVCGLNACQHDLFAEALGNTMMATNRIYRSADVIGKVEQIVENDLSALLSTIMPVGEVLN